MLIKTFEVGKTLLIDGSACVNIISGAVEVFGFQLRNRQTVVREGKRLPFYVMEKAELDISLGTNAGLLEIEGNTIPPSWIDIAQSLLDMQKKPTVVLIVGKIDSGKSSFCTYLLNRLVTPKRCVAVLDGDMGQSDIGPPGTLGYALASKPATDLYSLKTEDAVFVGVTTPVKAIKQTVDGFAKLQAEILKKNPDFIIINTDGWVTGEDAIQYKAHLVELLKPDLIVGIQIEKELEPLLSTLGDKHVKIIESPVSVKERDQEKRQKLREKSYGRYLQNAKVRLLYLNQYKIENSEIIEEYGKEAEGLLLGFLNNKNKFLGIGILMEVNKKKKALKVFTPVESIISTIIVGKVHFDKQLKET
jgi:polynucleotide 5'-hydroxyl-kinase GRC3/NOL9